MSGDPVIRATRRNSRRCVVSCTGSRLADTFYVLVFWGTKMASLLHYAVLTIPARSHARPEFCLALRLLRLHPHLRITVFLAASLKSSTDHALFRFDLTDGEEERLRLVQYDMTSVPPDPNGAEEDDESFKRLCEWTAEMLRPAFQSILNASDPFLVSRSKS